MKPKTTKYNLMLSQLKEAQKKAIKEEGCLSYKIFTGADDTILLYEQWSSQYHLSMHLSLNYLKELKTSMEDNLIKNFDKYINEIN